ncbi:MAG: DUF1343 domain-containing protein [Chloroflexi bacterium]|nr:DUF1343 domain-containing protein [Chloroflexota bacterium]
MRDGFAPLRGKRVGLLTNPSGVTRDLTRTLDVFRAKDVPFTLAALFTPEHGLAAAVADGASVNSSVDPVSGAPVYSLYGETFAPTAEMLSDIDVMVCDIQDIGVRYYTYAWTISHVLNAAGLVGVPVILLDRPNPLGDTVDGALLDRRYESLVGGAPVPVQHGMTLGELMALVNDLYNTDKADLTVIRCEGCERDMPWEATGLTFVPPSPAMPHLSTARQYPGACLIEGTNLSEGRGTALPFEISGAPYVDAEDLAAHLNGLHLEGVRFRPHAFTPSAGKFAGQECQGVQVHVVGRAFRALTTWMQVIRAASTLYPADFAFKPGTFDRLYGSDAGRAWVESGAGIEALEGAWAADAAAWRSRRSGYLLYR